MKIRSRQKSSNQKRDHQAHGSGIHQRNNQPRLACKSSLSREKELKRVAHVHPTKCVFGVPSGQLLGFLVSNRGIEASTKQDKAIMDMKPPKKVKDIQKLTGCMAALNRLISQLGEKGLPFFKLLKKIGNFEWIEEAEEAFQKLKEYLASSPVMTPPKGKEDMMLYIIATKKCCQHSSSG